MAQLEKDARRLLQSVQPNDLLRIVLDNPNGWYFPGAAVSGSVVVRAKESIKSRGVYVHFVGRAKTDWSSVEGTGHRTSRLRRSGEITYADEEVQVWKPDESNKHLPLNESQFAFSFQIPNGAPPSFEGRHGHIRYLIKATVNRPWFLDCKRELCFSVVPYFDLRLLPHLAEPLALEEGRTFGGALFGRRGAVRARLALPKRGFVPGEALAATLRVANSGGREVRALELLLEQRAHYAGALASAPPRDAAARRSGQTRTVPTVVARARRDFRPAHRADFAHTECLTVPPLVPTFNICPLLQVDYVLKAYVVLKQDPIQFETPVLIGTIPTEAAPAADAAPVLEAHQPSQPLQPYQSDQQHQLNQLHQPNQLSQPNQLCQSNQPNQLYQPNQPNQLYQPTQPNPPQQPNQLHQPHQPDQPLYPTLPSAPPPDYDLAAGPGAAFQVRETAACEKGGAEPAEGSSQCGEPPPDYAPKCVYYPNLH